MCVKLFLQQSNGTQGTMRRAAPQPAVMGPYWNVRTGTAAPPIDAAHARAHGSALPLCARRHSSPPLLRNLSLHVSSSITPPRTRPCCSVKGTDPPPHPDSALLPPNDHTGGRRFATRSRLPRIRPGPQGRDSEPPAAASRSGLPPPPAPRRQDEARRLLQDVLGHVRRFCVGGSAEFSRSKPPPPPPPPPLARRPGTATDRTNQESKAAPRQIAPRKMTPRKMAPRKMAPRQIAPRKIAPRQIAPRKMASRKMAPRKIAPRQIAPGKMASRKMAPRQLSPRKMAPRKMAPRKMAPRQRAPRKIAPACVRAGIRARARHVRSVDERARDGRGRVHVPAPWCVCVCTHRMKRGGGGAESERERVRERR